MYGFFVVPGNGALLLGLPDIQLLDILSIRSVHPKDPEILTHKKQKRDATPTKMEILIQSSLIILLIALSITSCWAQAEKLTRGQMVS